jgi:hypothetical protein
MLIGTMTAPATLIASGVPAGGAGPSRANRPVFQREKRYGAVARLAIETLAADLTDSDRRPGRAARPRSRGD